jgi:hypothetical protein
LFRRQYGFSDPSLTLTIRLSIIVCSPYWAETNFLKLFSLIAYSLAVRLLIVDVVDKKNQLQNYLSSTDKNANISYKGIVLLIFDALSINLFPRTASSSAKDIFPSHGHAVHLPLLYLQQSDP